TLRCKWFCAYHLVCAENGLPPGDTGHDRPARLYLGRAAGGDWHHWHFDRSACACGPEGPGVGQPDVLREQSQADGGGLAQLPRRLSLLSVWFYLRAVRSRLGLSRGNLQRGTAGTRPWLESLRSFAALPGARKPLPRHSLRLADWRPIKRYGATHRGNRLPLPK